MSKFFNTDIVSDSESWGSDSESDKDKKNKISDKKNYKSESDSDSESESDENINTFKKKRGQSKKGKKTLANLKKEKEKEKDKEVNIDINDLEIPSFFEIHIRVKQRNGKKKITSIEGIPEKYLLDKDIANNLLLPLKSKLASRADRKKDKESGEYYIEVSGSDVAIIKGILIDNITECTESNIKVHGI
jgi:translation initiation factor 1